MIHNTNKAHVTKLNTVPKQYYSANEKINVDNEHETKYIIKEGFLKERNFKKRMIAAVATLALLTGFIFVSPFTVGYTVILDDTVIGTVAAKSEYYDVLDEVKTEVMDIADAEFEPVGEESFNVEIVKKDDFTKKETLAENLKSMSNEMTEAAVIMYNGEFFAAVSTEDEAKSILDTYLSDKKMENENMTAEFLNDVSVITMHVRKEIVKSKDQVYACLLAGKSVEHIVQPGETIEDIAKIYNTTAEAILIDNGLTKKDDLGGKTLTIYTGEPIISVKTVEHINGEFEIPFETESYDDDELYRGKTVVDIEGENGLKYVESYITRVDDTITDEMVIRNEILKNPVTQEQRVGTKEPPPQVGTGEFAMPTSGTLTSSFGARWGRQHAGIDIGAAVGTPIYASDNGVVTEAQFKNNGYGNFISIDHDNGYVTYYAHCSEILVSAGDIVAKGDLIARVGSTGRSTGPHLHFEVRKDGVAQNPYDYLK